MLQLLVSRSIGSGQSPHAARMDRVFAVPALNRSEREVDDAVF